MIPMNNMLFTFVSSSVYEYIVKCDKSLMNLQDIEETVHKTKEFLQDMLSPLRTKRRTVNN